MQLDAHEQRVVDTIERVGWYVMGVSPNEGNPDPRWFAYTIGLAVKSGWPELICLGLDLDVIGELVNNAVLELKNREVPPSPGQELTDVIEDFPAKLEIFPKKLFLDHLGWAMWFAHYRGIKPEQFGCLQLLCPDKKGYFPSDVRCDPVVRSVQTPVSRRVQ